MSAPDHDDSVSDDELDPDEPRTPMWLPLLGLCLFVSGLVYAMIGGKPPAEPAVAAPSASTSAAPAATGANPTE
ncbi:MAG TPA: hypothetical protein VH062_03070 [Polyangiaceae bacterium]|jgi:hypothetical protein|nr:hypothetical protein [Polyangiaceae bacterium]